MQKCILYITLHNSPLIHTHYLHTKTMEVM